jgi:peptide/nickel transport system ATP-binding protein
MLVALMTDNGEGHLRPGEVLLKVTHLVVEYPSAGGGRVHAVSDVSIDLVEGETLGLVGESGCGKSTLGRAILQLPRPKSGSVIFENLDLTHVHGKQLRRIRQKVQIIFQDPISSLNPRHRIFDIVADPLRMWRTGTKAEIAAKVRQVLQDVGLDPDAVGRRRPFELSGGQCQRVCIARALIQEPKVLVCDEPVSSLDVSVQAQVLNLLEDMKLRYGLTLLFIAHDPGEALRGVLGRRPLPAAGASLHEGTAPGYPDSRSRAQAEHRRGNHRRIALTGLSPLRVQVPDSMPASGRDMRR